MARQPLTPSQKRYRRRGWIIIQLIALVIFIAGDFAMKPLLDRPARTDDLLVQRFAEAFGLPFKQISEGEA